MTLELRAPGAADRAAWQSLWRGYLAFYNRSDLPDDVTEATWARILDPHGPICAALAIDDDGAAIGLVHWLAHAATWSTGPYCYLEDLYVDPAHRGGGVGRALIEHVRSWATDAGCEKVYWLTAHDNATARALYDRVATHTGMVQYQIGLDTVAAGGSDSLA